MKFMTYKADRGWKFRNGARLRWVGDDYQLAVVVRLGKDHWLNVRVDRGTGAVGEPTGSRDETYARELSEGLWVEV